MLSEINNKGSCLFYLTLFPNCCRAAACIERENWSARRLMRWCDLISSIIFSSSAVRALNSSSLTSSAAALPLPVCVNGMCGVVWEDVGWGHGCSGTLLVPELMVQNTQLLLHGFGLVHGFPQSRMVRSARPIGGTVWHCRLDSKMFISFLVFISYVDVFFTDILWYSLS